MSRRAWLSPRWLARLLALVLLALGLALLAPAAAWLLARTLGAAIQSGPGELALLGATFGVGSACLVAAYWTVAE
mgnify:CR=1 FL=1